MVSGLLVISAVVWYGAAPLRMTGGEGGLSESEEDWQDMYQGCGAALDEAQLHDGVVKGKPECAGHFETCTERALAEVGQNKRLAELCACLSSYKVCVENFVSLVVHRNGSRVAPHGCPDILYSRMCAAKEEVLIGGLVFDDANKWSCGSCEGVLDESEECISGLHENKCFCHFNCPDDYTRSCDGFRCHSITCLLALMRCWKEHGCTHNTAWNICLHDTGTVIKDDSGQFAPTERSLRCRLSTCREAITHVETSDLEAYAWVGLFVVILAIGSLFICITHRRGRRNMKTLSRRHSLIPDKIS